MFLVTIDLLNIVKRLKSNSPTLKQRTGKSL